MTNRIFKAICLAALAVMVATLILIIGFLYSYFSQIQWKQLRSEAMLTVHAVANQGSSFFEGLKPTDCRITWIAADGTVLYDSSSNPDQNENHLEREEIRSALTTGYGESTRYSATLNERFLYCAHRLPDGTVLRLSMAQKSLFTVVLGTAQPISVVMAVAIVLSLFLAFQLSRQVVKPLNELDLNDPLSNVEYEELTPLLRRIDSQQQQLRYQAGELRRKKTEFDTVTGSMSEGLLLLNDQGLILSMNPAASGLLGISRGFIGKDFLANSSHQDVEELVRTALFGQHGEKAISLPQGEYQVVASPVRADEQITGVVLLMIDIGEKQKAEAMRREFTANVSHELKTPLHSISGYAELMQSGLVQPQDITGFAGKIYTEAQRLIRLVEDILRLSRLDENFDRVRQESVDLYTLASEVVAGMQPQAALASVSLDLTGISAPISGFPAQLSAIIANLCSNAIKYNRPGGHVTVSVQDEGSHVELTVADTGIGIPPEHQARIFERFYRVDKSHSKSVGGTGLGLSIVKHAAMIHRAEISLDSAPDRGTTVTIRFPKEL